MLHRKRCVVADGDGHETFALPWLAWLRQQGAAIWRNKPVPEATWERVQGL